MHVTTRTVNKGLSVLALRLGCVRGARWFETDVSEPPIGSIFKGQTGYLDINPCRRDRYVVPKRQTLLRRAITQRTE